MRISPQPFGGNGENSQQDGHTQSHGQGHNNNDDDDENNNDDEDDATKTAAKTTTTTTTTTTAIKVEKLGWNTVTDFD